MCAGRCRSIPSKLFALKLNVKEKKNSTASSRPWRLSTNVSDIFLSLGASAKFFVSKAPLFKKEHKKCHRQRVSPAWPINYLKRSKLSLSVEQLLDRQITPWNHSSAIRIMTTTASSDVDRSCRSACGWRAKFRTTRPGRLPSTSGSLRGSDEFRRKLTRWASKRRHSVSNLNGFNSEAIHADPFFLPRIRS